MPESVTPIDAFIAMSSCRPVWVNSPAQQETRIEGLFFLLGEWTWFDREGNDRPLSELLLNRLPRLQVVK